MTRRRRGVLHAKPVGVTPLREVLEIGVLLTLKREGPLSLTVLRRRLGLVSKADWFLLDRTLRKHREAGLVEGDPIRLTEAGRAHVDAKILRIAPVEVEEADQAYLEAEGEEAARAEYEAEQDAIADRERQLEYEEGHQDEGG